eukprot:TRINITY_DN1864_c0_g2_i1.p1 TRINITY_DN1864_c0_g2~~TRINITY_DN1864_c0_g2_i1.p1  ORF type:complete len:109 (-),score=8.41 TRINITY_DN1864_c0_g2_i1:740-1066(-)
MDGGQKVEGTIWFQDDHVLAVVVIKLRAGQYDILLCNGETGTIIAQSDGCNGSKIGEKIYDFDVQQYRVQLVFGRVPAQAEMFKGSMVAAKNVGAGWEGLGSGLFCVA